MWMLCVCNYCIVPNCRGAKFSRIGLLKHFVEINFADQRFLMATPIFHYIPRSLIFTVREESAKTAKMMRLKNLALYHNVYMIVAAEHMHA